MKIVIVGGAGFLGSRAAQALRKMPDLEVVVASRNASGSGSMRLDLNDATTFTALDGADVVANVTNSSIAAPDALAGYCLEHGIRFLEASSDGTVVQRLYETFHERTGTPGTIVLGAGIFTGMSNLLGRAAARGIANCESLELGIRSSPLSGSGSGTIALMVDALAMDTISYVDGARVKSPPIRRGPVLPFPTGVAPTLHVPLAEAEMLHASTGVPNVRVFLSPKPNVLQTMFMVLPAFALRNRFFGWFMRIYFTVLRRGLLSSRASEVEMVAIALCSAPAR